jgi:hypothetical protein
VWAGGAGGFQILNSLEPIFREQVAQCTTVGDATEEFPNGEWLDCNEQLIGRAKWALATITYAFIGMGLQVRAAAGGRQPSPVSAEPQPAARVEEASAGGLRLGRADGRRLHGQRRLLPRRHRRAGGAHAKLIGSEGCDQHRLRCAEIHSAEHLHSG